MSGEIPVGRGAAIFGLSGTQLLPEERAFFRDYDPFGFILFARNVENPYQLKVLTSDLREAVGREAPILVDQEGGRVQRLRAPHWREWPAPYDTVSNAGSLDQAAAIMGLRARIIAAELAAVGIDANCAPLGDIAMADTHPFLKNRCYGDTANVVTKIARAVADGLLAGGVLPVMKHLPGHGRTRMDSHHDLPHADTAEAELVVSDFAPFWALSDLPMAMTAHIVFSALDDRPSTQSPVMIGHIRKTIGFDGLLMTDDLNMQALSGTLAERTAASIVAGCDIALHCKGDLLQMREVAEAAGDMGREGLARAAGALAARRPVPEVDIAALDDELLSLTKG